MNSKVLAIIAVLVALLTGWLVLSVIQKPSANLDAATPKTSVLNSSEDSKDAVDAGESGSVQTRVVIPQNVVKTEVKITK